jgi:hypothetical protein
LIKGVAFDRDEYNKVHKKEKGVILVSTRAILSAGSPQLINRVGQLGTHNHTAFAEVYSIEEW